MTVSRSLNNAPGVGEKMKAEVLKAADQLGYHLNPLVAANMSNIRSRRKGNYTATLAVLCSRPKDQSWPSIDSRIEGALARSEELGFGCDVFDLADDKFTPANLDRIIKNRGIRGLIVTPIEMDLSQCHLDYSRLSVILCFPGSQPQTFPRVIPDHYGNMDQLLRKLGERGYRKIGLMVSEELDLQTAQYWQSKYFSYCQSNSLDPIPPYMPSLDSNYSVDTFRDWFGQHLPEVLITTCERIFESRFFERSGLPIPKDVAVVKVNINCMDRNVSGITEASAEVGRVAVEILSQHMYNNSYGLQNNPFTVLVPGQWTDRGALAREGVRFQPIA